jgi:hypothetical protein
VAEDVDGALHTFEFKNAYRLVAQLSPKNLDGRQINPAVAVAWLITLRSREAGMGVTLGQDNVLSYEDVASLAAEKWPGIETPQLALVFWAHS